jgi:adenylate cyclase
VPPPPGAALAAPGALGWLFRLRGPRVPPPAVAVVAIDREAAQALGLPARPADWPRTLHARLIDVLSLAHASVIAFDLSFATPARHSDDDRALAAALARANTVVLLDFLERHDGSGADLLIERRLPPIPLLADAAAAHGPFPLPKAGGVHAWWLFKPGAGQAATLPVLVAQVHDRSAPARSAPRRFAPGEEARYLDFYGPPRSVPTIGFDRVLAAAQRGAEGAAWLRETFAGRAVFVGFSAASPAEQDRTRDDYRTVYSRADGLDLSGVEIAATALANLLEDRWPRPLPHALQFALFAGWALALALLCTALRGAAAVTATAAAAAGYLALAHLRFGASAQWLPLTTPLLVQAPLALFGGVLWHYVDERRERRRLGALITDLLPATVVAHLLSRIRSVAPLERPMFGVFVMTDIQGFTSIAETMAPADATRMLNDYFALVFPAIEKHGGSVSEIDGDGMLAFWLDDGPAAQARRGACLAALEIAEVTRRADPLPGWPALPTRIGVHGGPITLARLGASRHHEYRAVGDAANTASRIEQLSKHLGTKLLVSAEVLDGLDGLLSRPVGTFLLAGKATPVRVHELIARDDAATPEQRRLCQAFAAALQAHAGRRWDEATAILQGFPNDGPSRFYLQQAQRLAAQPLPDWDGIVRMATK